MGFLSTRLFGALLLATCLVAREIHHKHETYDEAPKAYPESYGFKPYDGEIAQAKAMAPGCPQGDGYMQCPTPNFGTAATHWPCVKYDSLCDGRMDCPQGEDEHPSMCMYHKMLDQEMDRIRKIILGAQRPH